MMSCLEVSQAPRNSRCLGLLTMIVYLAGQAALASAASSVFQSVENASVADFEHGLAKVQPLIDRYGYGAAFMAVLMEGVGIPMPGQTLLMASATEAAAGRMNIGLVLFLVTLAATLGNSIGYAIGRWGGRAVLQRLRVNPQRQRYIEDLFERRGGLVILFARFVDGLRQLNGIAAGMLRMPWWKFTTYNIAGALLWTCSWGMATYYLDRDIHFVATFLHRNARLFYFLSAVLFVALVAYLLTREKFERA